MKLGFFGNTGIDSKKDVLTEVYEAVINLFKTESVTELVFTIDFDFSYDVHNLIALLRKNGYKFSTTVILPDKDFKLHPGDIYDRTIYISDVRISPSKAHEFYIDYVDILLTYVSEINRDSYIKYVLASNRNKKMLHLKYDFFVE